MIRPATARLYSSLVAKKAACGPPNPSGTPNRCDEPRAMSAPMAPGDFSSTRAIRSLATAVMQPLNVNDLVTNLLKMLHRVVRENVSLRFSAGKRSLVARSFTIRTAQGVLTGKVGKAYGATNTPHMFVVDPKGVLVYAGALDDTKGGEPEPGDKVQNYVGAALEAVAGGKSVATSRTKAWGCSVKYGP